MRQRLATHGPSWQQQSQACEMHAQLTTACRVSQSAFCPGLGKKEQTERKSRRNNESAVAHARAPWWGEQRRAAHGGWDGCVQRPKLPLRGASWTA